MLTCMGKTHKLREKTKINLLFYNNWSNKLEDFVVVITLMLFDIQIDKLKMRKLKEILNSRTIFRIKVCFR